MCIPLLAYMELTAVLNSWAVSFITVLILRGVMPCLAPGMLLFSCYEESWSKVEMLP